MTRRLPAFMTEAEAREAGREYALATGAMWAYWLASPHRFRANLVSVVHIPKRHLNAAADAGREVLRDLEALIRADALKGVDNEETRTYRRMHPDEFDAHP